MSALETFSQLVKHQYLDLPICLTSSDCAGKTYIVTGANIGIGLESAKHLVRLGASRVILAVRSPERGASALAELESQTGRRGVAEIWPLDLASYASIQSFANMVETKLQKVDGLVQNAAGANSDWFECEGFESTVMVNVVGTMYLAVLLLPYLERCAQQYGTRPVLEFVTSTLGFSREVDLAKIGKNPILRDVSDEKKWTTDGTNRYALSKLLEMMAIRHFTELAPSTKTGVIMNHVSPGLCSTGLSRNGTTATKMAVGALRLAFGRSAEWGSRNVLHGLSLGDESHGKLLTYCEIKEDWVPEWLSNRDGQEWCKRLWDEIAAELERVQPGCVSAALEPTRAS